MLIAVSGSQGLGKSDLIEALKDRFEIGAIARKTSRSILADWGVTLSEVNNDRPLTLKFQDAILERKMQDEAAAAASTSFFVTERSYADLFTYAVAAIGKDNECSDWLDAYYAKCKAAQSSYKSIFYLSNLGRFPGPIKNDGVRAINKHYSQMIDLTMEAVSLEMAEDRTIWIESGYLDDRCAIIQTELMLSSKVR